MAVILAIAYGELVGSNNPVIKLFSEIGFGAFKGYMQLLPRFISLILLKGKIDSKMLIFIFIFSNKNSERSVLLA